MAALRLRNLWNRLSVIRHDALSHNMKTNEVTSLWRRKSLWRHKSMTSQVNDVTRVYDVTRVHDVTRVYDVTWSYDVTPPSPPLPSTPLLLRQGCCPLAATDWTEWRPPPTGNPVNHLHAAKYLKLASSISCFPGPSERFPAYLAICGQLFHDHNFLTIWIQSQFKIRYKLCSEIRCKRSSFNK